MFPLSTMFPFVVIPAVAQEDSDLSVHRISSVDKVKVPTAVFDRPLVCWHFELQTLIVLFIVLRKDGVGHWFLT